VNKKWACNKGFPFENDLLRKQYKAYRRMRWTERSGGSTTS